jgi:soluble lytic murein transglycosylase
MSATSAAHRILGVVAAIFALVPVALSQPALAEGTAAESETARSLFIELYPQVELGDWSLVDALGQEQRAALEAYPLWPDLEAAWLRANLSRVDRDRIDTFLETHGTLKPARDLRYAYALHLARRGEHERFLAVYRAFYQGLDVARLDCLALAAEIDSGSADRITERGIALWLTGQSQADECDPVFAWLEAEGRLTTAHYIERYALAIEARAFGRARWLGKSIDDDHVANAEAWQAAARDPAAYVRAQAAPATTEEARARLRYALERLTYADPIAALELWREAAARHPFTDTERNELERHIALWTARDRLPGAYDLLSALAPAARNTEVMRWRARTSLRDAAWRRLLADIDAMPVSERDEDEWRYWRAIALANTGDSHEADEILAGLASERGYYGFLAADALGEPYAFRSESLRMDEAVIRAIAGRPDIVRARELYRVGLDSRGRSEWDAAMSRLSATEQQQAAILANRWGWHSRAIATAARVSQYDDLELRYPLPFAEHFTIGATAAGIPATWALGVARSESLFMRDVRSGAGAVGLMQLMPATGRAVAKKINVSYNGLDTLTDPATNIRLGTSYLGEMTARFGGNRVLATAAYNAGPHRVDDWLPESAPVDSRVWIENIPFNETRKYVRRVLAAEAIFHWRMTGETRRLSDLLGAVLPANQTMARLGDAGDPHTGQ